MALNPLVGGVLDSVLGNSFVAPGISEPVHGDMVGKDWGGNPVSYEPVGGFEVAGSYGQPSGMPDYIQESIQRQYGNKKFGDYKIEDMKNVINWHKKA